METEYRVGTIGADDAGAPHRRERIWILAYTAVERLEGTEPIQSKEQCRPRISGMDKSQHPIGQLADPDLLGCLHGQAQEQPAAGGVHAQREPEPSSEDVADANGEPFARIAERRTERQEQDSAGADWWATEPGLGRVVDELADRLDIHGTPEPGSVPRVATGIAKRADRLKCIGNGQVPAAVVLAWHTLHERIKHKNT